VPTASGKDESYLIVSDGLRDLIDPRSVDELYEADESARASQMQCGIHVADRVLNCAFKSFCKDARGVQNVRFLANLSADDIATLYAHKIDGVTMHGISLPIDDCTLEVALHHESSMFVVCIAFKTQCDKDT